MWPGPHHSSPDHGTTHNCSTHDCITHNCNTHDFTTDRALVQPYNAVGPRDQLLFTTADINHL